MLLNTKDSLFKAILADFAAATILPPNDPIVPGELWGSDTDAVPE